MAAIITNIIPPQNIELIRDRIVQILGDELGNQYALNNSYPNIQKVWCERFIPINSETECPTVNVSIAKDEFDNETVLKTIGSVMYNIDIYTTAITSIETGDADQYAMITMTKIAGLIRSILAFPGYVTLGLDPGIIQETCIAQYVVREKSTVQDALSNVVGRIMFMVKCIETNEIIDTAVPINELTTTVYLNGSNEGYFYDYKQQVIHVTETGPTLRNVFFSNTITQIELLDDGDNVIATYVWGTDFTQNADIITASSFEFTDGTKIIAKT